MDIFLETICRKESLPLESIEPMSGGQINRIYRVGPELVLRVARTAEDSHRLRVEAEVIRKAGAALPDSRIVPQIVSTGEVEGRAYQLQRRIRGEKLHRLWPGLGMAQKESIITQLGQFLEALHRMPVTGMGMIHGPEISKPCATWQEYCEEWFAESPRNLAGLEDGIPPRILDMAAERFERDKALLAGSSIVLVHADLWPGNILVDGETVTGILDFEFAHAAPRDYELLLIEDFCLYPNDFVEEDFEFVCAADYADFFRLLQKHTPTLFSIPYLRERLDLYHLLFNLHLYATFRLNGGEDTGGYLLAKLARITNVLFGHGVRMFV